MGVEPDGALRPADDRPPTGEVQIIAGIEDHEEGVEPRQAGKDRARVEAGDDRAQDLLALLEPVGISQVDLVSRAGDIDQTGPVEARPVPDRRLDERPELVAAIRKEPDVLAEAAEDRGLVEDSPQSFEGTAFLADDVVRGDGPDQAEEGHGARTALTCLSAG